MPKVCAVPNCSRTFKNQRCSVFQVPQDEESRRKWEDAIPGIEVLKSSQNVCERHFEPLCIVRNLSKRGPDGKILINIPYKRPRLLKSVVPSIFECGSPAHGDADNENRVIAVKKHAARKLHVHYSAPCFVQKAAPLRAIENQQEASVQSARNDEGTIAPSQINADEPSVKIASNLATDDRFVKFAVTNNSEIHFETVDDIVTVILSKPWSLVEGHERLILSQIITNRNIPIILKSVVIDDKRKMEYAVHGQVIKHDVPQLPQDLTDPRILPSILMEFNGLRVCNGLKNINVDLAEPATVCTDNINVNRSTKCMLIGERKTCNQCLRIRKTLLQKNDRFRKRGRFKRCTVPSNPGYQNKLSFMRLKINRERRTKNLHSRRLKLLSESLKQKQDELRAVKDHLLEQRCVLHNVPEIQRTALREIIASAKQTDLRGRRYNNEWIMMCMLMNIRSPVNYEFLRKNKIVPLPCMRTIRNYFSLIDSKCGFDEKFFELLKLKFKSKTPIQRHGLLVCDEISLRKSLTVSPKDLTYEGFTDLANDGTTAVDIDEQATYGLVLLFQPLADAFTQPIAIFASKNTVKGEELAKLMVKAITLLEQSGALIHGIVADGAHINNKTGTSLDIDTTLGNCKSWFTHPMDNERRVFVFSDVPNLIKNVRNRLYNQKKLRVSRSEGYVQWQFFEKLLDIDTNHIGNARVCPKITKRHIQLDSTSKMRVRLATQIFSNSVADGMKFYLDQKFEEFRDCEETIKFCKRFNDLFDALNRKMPNQGLTPDTEDFKIIQTSLKWLDDWERAQIDGHVTSDEFLTADTANGLRLSLHSTMGLCRYLIKKYNFKYLLSGKVNQDNLEKFFGTIRQAAASNDHPSCSNFLELYKLLSVYSVIKPPICGNFTVDGDGKPLEVLVTNDDLVDIYGCTESKVSQITRKLQLKLDELIEHQDWKIDHLGDHDYSQPQVPDCIIDYVTDLIGGRPIVNLGTRFLSSMAQALKTHGVVPDVIDNVPKDVLKVTYPSDLTVEIGKELTPTQVKDKPTVQWNAESAAFYTLCMTDPDAPSRKEPIYREWHHWLVGNIPGDKVSDGEVLSDYIGSGPPPKTGLHRYVFLVYKQSGKINFDEKRLTNKSDEGRAKFQIRKFAEKHKLGEPIAGTMYQAEYDDYVPILYKQLGA